MSSSELYDVAVVGGGPCGATAASDLARQGFKVALIDKAGRIKPCGGAIPPRLIKDFDIPDELLTARVKMARIFAPSARTVDMPIDGDGFVAMVDREHFDEWLRKRAACDGAERVTGVFEKIDRDGSEHVRVRVRTGVNGGAGSERTIRACMVIGADGALSSVARQEIAGGGRIPYVFAYHEIIRTPAEDLSAGASALSFDPARCDIYYDGRVSPDFYAWIFPHGTTTSIGTGSANKGFSLRDAVGSVRRMTNLDRCETIRREGAPIPLRPLKRWDNGRDCLVAGDAAGVVAPASGEGIYYAMLCGRLAANAVSKAILNDNPKYLAQARKDFMKRHRTVFFILGMMQRFWYRNDTLRERFVSMCADKDVQRLTWESYMNKELSRRKPAAHIKIFLKDLAHLTGLVPP